MLVLVNGRKVKNCYKNCALSSIRITVNVKLKPKTSNLKPFFPMLILASTSPRRKELLSQLGFDFKAVGSDYEEDMTLDLPPHELAKILSAGKAEAVAADFPDDVVVAADTFIFFNGKPMGKPSGVDDAVQTLKKLSGNVISVITGFTVILNRERKQVSESVETKVFIKELTEDEIAGDIKTEEPLDKAGAFAIQGKGAAIVEKIDGDYFNVVGLPLNRLSEVLKGFGISVF